MNLKQGPTNRPFKGRIRIRIKSPFYLTKTNQIKAFIIWLSNRILSDRIAIWLLCKNAHLAFQLRLQLMVEKKIKLIYKWTTKNIDKWQFFIKLICCTSITVIKFEAIFSYGRIFAFGTELSPEGIGDFVSSTPYFFSKFLSE